MGLDVTAYRKLTEQPRPDGDPYESDLFFARENTDFPGRIEGVKDGAFYTYAE